MQNETEKAMSLAEACASVGKRPEQFPANNQCARCGTILSRYNPYDICSACQKSVRTGKLRKVSVALPRTEKGRVYWSSEIVTFMEREPLPQNQQLRENPFAR